MMKRLLPVLVLGLGFGLLTTLPAPAAESAVSAEKISKLIEKMGSSEFDDREKAQAQLEAIGAPALEALKKATASKDTEVRRRAEELVKKIESRAESAKLLQPTKVHLVYKDTPIAAAVADFAKKTGFNITLHDPDGKLKDRKITLDTGETTFWKAYDKFCAAANLVEATQEDLLPKAQPGQNGRPGLPGQPGGGGIVPLPNPNPVKPNIRSTVPAQPVPQRKFDRVGALQAQAAQPAQKQPTVEPKPAVQPLPAVQAPIQGVIVRPGVRFGQALAQPGQIILKDGKPTPVPPTDSETSFRVRQLEKLDNLSAPEAGQLLIGLQVSPEPKITWQRLLGVTVTKAVDEKDQTLAQGAVAVPEGQPANLFAIPVLGRGVGMFFRSIHQEVPVYLKKGEKNSKSLKELSGVIKAEVLAPAKAVITTDDVFKSVNKTFKGGDKGWIKIIDVKKAANGQVRVRYEMQAPADVVPAQGGIGGAGGGGIWNGPVPLPRIQIQPALPNQPALPKGALQVRIQAVGQARAIQFLPANGANGNGLHVIDEKGNVIPVTVQQQWVNNGNVVQVQTTAIFQLPKEMKVAKLVFSGSRSVTVEVPFTLKDVKLP